jgi:ABC-2 type transport system permease protein
MAWGGVKTPAGDLLTPTWFQEIMGRLQICNHRLLPGWWLTSGLVDAAQGVADESVLFLTLTISNALFFRQLSLWIADRIYRPAYSGLYGKSLRRKHSRFVWLDGSLSQLLCWLPRSVRLMTVKDFRLFRRDPLQWSQVLIFVALIVVYFFNVPNFTYDVSVKAWVNMVGFLNLAVVGLLLSTFTTRFVYPMISLEGRRFWILGLLGVRRESVLWNKFFFALLSIIPCSGLVFLSDHILHVLRNDPEVALLHQWVGVVLCFGLAGIAVGFGAWFPNPREDSPSRLAAGFGGTMTLVVSTLFILILVLMTALPTHYRLTTPHVVQSAQSMSELGRNDRGATSQDEPKPNWIDTLDRVELAWWGSVAGSVVLGAVVTLVPLWIGFRAFRRLEF